MHMESMFINEVAIQKQKIYERFAKTSLPF